MEFRILGPLEVADAGRPLPLGGTKQRALLAILLLHANEVVARDRLIDALWGGRPPDTAATALQVHVSQLRKLLAADGARGDETPLVTRAPGYVLRIEPEQLDLHRFEQLVGEGNAALARGDATAARATLAEALALWRGPPLADLHSLPFVRQEAVRLEDLRLAALEERIEADFALGRHADLVPELDKLVAAHPLRERVRGQLMLALYRCGRQADALEVYQKGRRLLAEELGLDPGHGLQRLERAILNQEPELAPPPARPGPPRATEAPAGVVTFLFTDIEGSTRLAKLLRNRWGEVLAAHQLALREAFARHGGHEVDTQGDAFFFAFPSARDALIAAVEGQRALEVTEWPEGVRVRARVGLHTSQASLADGRYVGVGVHRAARICTAAHGGQVLLSQATRELLEDEEAEELVGALRDLGPYRLKDLDRPVRLYQVVAPGLDQRFPPVRAEREPARKRRLPLALAATAVAVAAAAAATLALMGDSGGAILVAPNSVAVIDPDANDVVAAIPVGESPGPIVAGLGAVWVLNRNDLTISKLDPATRQVVDVLPTVTQGAQSVEASSVALLAAGEGALWTGHAAILRRSEPDSVASARAITLPTLDYWTAIAAGLGRVWAAGGAPHLLQIHPDRATIDDVTPLDAADDIYGASNVAVGLRSVWVAFDAARRHASAVFRYDPVSGDVARLPLGGAPSAIAVGDNAVWVADAEADALLRIRPRPLAVVRSIPVGDEPVAVAAGSGAIWTANASDGTISRVDPGSNEVTTIRLGHRPQGVVVANGLVWVSVRSE